MFDFPNTPVCVASGPRDAYVLLAIRPERRGDEDIVWDDGTHQRAFGVAEVLEDTRARFRFRDDRGRVLSLEPMTAALYGAKIQAETGGPDLTSDRAVRDWYLQPRSW